MLTLLLLTSAASAEEEVAAASTSWRIQLTPPDFHRDVAPKVSGLDLAVRASNTRTHPLHLSLDLSVSMLRLAVHGDYRPGLAPFLGTSTTSLGGLRLRF